MASTIKPKKGRCKLCPPNFPETYITKDGLCQNHYWSENAKKNAEKKKKNGTAKAKAKTAKDLNVFFASQIPEIPSCCENCGSSLKWQKMNNFKSIIAHILPKRKVGGFPSVATHPKNRVFLCLECHTNMDNKGSDFVKNMKCFDLICERFFEFEHLLSEADKQRLPLHFQNLKNV